MTRSMMRAATFALLGSAAAAASAPAQQTATLPARDRMLTERPVPVYTVGTAEGESWEMFSGIMGMAFDRADNLYVLDTGNARVVVFSPAGRFLRQFGKRGSGPGELQAPLSLVVAADGNIVINDVANRAFVIFRPTGEHVRNVPYPMDGMIPLGGIQAAPDGSVVVRATRRPGAQTGPQTGAQQQTTSTIYRFGLAASADPAPLASFAMPAPQLTSTGPERRTFIGLEPVFSARPSYGVLPDGGVALHHEDTYAVKIHDAAGRHVRTVSRPIKPRKVTKKDREAWATRSLSSPPGSTFMVTSTGGSAPSVSFGGGGGGTVRVPQTDRTFADVMSVISGIRTDMSGRIWIQRRDTDGGDAGPIDLVDASGRYIGTVPPQPLPSTVSASGLAAYVVRDDMGIERVSVRRLPGSWR